MISFNIIPTENYTQGNVHYDVVPDDDVIASLQEVVEDSSGMLTLSSADPAKNMLHLLPDTDMPQQVIEALFSLVHHNNGVGIIIKGTLELSVNGSIDENTIARIASITSWDKRDPTQGRYYIGASDELSAPAEYRIDNEAIHVNRTVCSALKDVGDSGEYLTDTTGLITSTPIALATQSVTPQSYLTTALNTSLSAIKETSLYESSEYFIGDNVDRETTMLASGVYTARRHDKLNKTHPLVKLLNDYFGSIIDQKQSLPVYDLMRIYGMAPHEANIMEFERSQSVIGYDGVSPWDFDDQRVYVASRVVEVLRHLATTMGITNLTCTLTNTIMDPLTGENVMTILDGSITADSTHTDAQMHDLAVHVLKAEGEWILGGLKSNIEISMLAGVVEVKVVIYGYDQDKPLPLRNVLSIPNAIPTVTGQTDYGRTMYNVASVVNQIIEPSI